MTQPKTNTYALTRGLGGLFIFASFQFLENSQFIYALILLAIGIVNMLPYLWMKRWTSIGLYGLNTISCSVVFYEFVQMETRYLQWLWLALFIYYVIRLRHFFRTNEPKRTQMVNKEHTTQGPI